MKGSIEDYYRSLDGKWRIRLAVEGDFSEDYEKLKDSDVNIEISKWRQRKTDAQNRYMWWLANAIALVRKMKKDDVYREAVKNVGGVSTIVCVQNKAVDKLIEQWGQNGIGWQAETMDSQIAGCTNVILYYGSSTFNTEQMAALINILMMDAEDLKINTDTPQRAAYWEYLESIEFEGNAYIGGGRYKTFKHVS